MRLIARMPSSSSPTELSWPGLASCHGLAARQRDFVGPPPVYAEISAMLRFQ